MIATPDTVHDLTARLEECRERQEQIWDRFASDFDKKAEVVTSLIELGFSLTADQVEEMEQNAVGFPTTALTGAQAALLSEAEPLAREIRFLAHIKDQTLAGSTLRYDAAGHVQFTWGSPGVRAGLGINWLPYSQCSDQRRESFAEAQRAWSHRREWLVRRHYAEFRQLADCCRLVFLVALSLSPDQVAGVVKEAGTPVTALRLDQQALLEAASRLYPLPVRGVLRDYSARFEPGGQFWLMQSEGADSVNYGVGWLPYSWE
jgi:hypothetical protein